MVFLRQSQNHDPCRPERLCPPAQKSEAPSCHCPFIETEAQMTHLYFHCSGPGEVLVDCHGTDVLDLVEARDHALAIARLIAEENFGLSDFSEWIVFVYDEDEDEMLSIPFKDALPTLH
jgi:hypothetical protein